MRAALVEAIGEPPDVREVPQPKRGAGQALVEVSAAPLNPIDLSIAGGRFYAGTPGVPYVAGREGVGVVVEGDSLTAGARVRFEAGMPGGSFAERVVVDEDEAVEIDGAIDDSFAACLGIAGLAAWLPLESRAELRPGESVLVLGASGPVGQVAIQAARLMGAGRVVAAARDAASLERSRALGAHAVVDLTASAGPDELAEAFRDAARGRIDVTIDPLWGAPAVAAVLAAAPFGRLVQIGQSADPEARLSSASLRGRPTAILGHTNGAFPSEARSSAYRRMVEHAAAGRLEIEHEVLGLDRVAEAWERQAAFPRRKLVLRP